MGSVLKSVRIRVNPWHAFREKENGPQAQNMPAGRPVDWLGLTKRWSLYVASTATPGSWRDLPARRNPSLFTGSVRAVALAVAKAPLRATSSKSQPPHLVYEHHNYCLQNLSSDHLLSGVRGE
jgi:hypothetical protein